MSKEIIAYAIVIIFSFLLRKELKQIVEILKPETKYISIDKLKYILRNR